MKHVSSVVGSLVVGALLLGACGTESVSANSSRELPSTTSSPSSDEDELETNERGYLPKELGETAGIGYREDDDPGGVDFTLDSVDVDPSCAPYSDPPTEGHTLLLHFRVATGDNSKYAQATAQVLNPNRFAELDSDGVTHSAEMGTCTDASDRLPHQYGVNQKYVGTIELVVPEASGTLILDLPSLENTGGWEWHY